MKHKVYPRRRPGLSRTRKGYSQFEAVLSLGLVAFGLMTVAGGAVSAVKAALWRPDPAVVEAEFKAALKTVADSLRESHHAHMGDGRRIMGEFQFNWTVTNSKTSSLSTVKLAGSGPGMMADTVVIYLLNHDHEH